MIMSIIEIKPEAPAIEAYYQRLQNLKTGQMLSNEEHIRKAFSDLLEQTAKARSWTLVEELGKKSSKSSKLVYPDGTLRDQWRLPHGYWEAKDSADDLDVEISKKRERGYPFDNIIFEDSRRAVLYQDNVVMMDISLDKREDLARLLSRFLNHKIAPFERFGDAVNYFTGEIPQIAKGLRDIIEKAHKDNKKFKDEFAGFMELCRSSLNPNLSEAAVDEMLIQHMLSERLIRKIFQGDFTRRNIIASKVEEVIDALSSQHFSREEFLQALEPFYVAIEQAAERLADYQNKQAFINTVYERFFQGYSVKVADTHGIVYTPQEIVDFMCAAVEEVLATEFGKKLGQDGVTVLDPATGTGNFIINLLNRVEPRYRREFYAKHLFANEVMLMPYYIAGLNIEHAYYELENHYEPFEGLCFVDTLDLAKKKQMSFSFMTEKNTARVQRQQEADITVIIGNPPYNVGQINENDNNKNRAYEIVDERIRETYVKDSAATNTKAVYDAYTKFFRWATDRLGNNDGVICYVSNNSFIDSLAFDGMRKHLYQDFERMYLLDLKGNVRQDSMREGYPIGAEHTVFGLAAMVGISISILIKKKSYTDHKIFHHAVDWKAKREEKFAFLKQVETLGRVSWRELTPNKKYTWLIGSTDDEFATGTALGNKNAKRAKQGDDVIFVNYSRGTETTRDAWVYNFSREKLEENVKHTIEFYNTEVDRWRRVSPKPQTKKALDTLIDDFVSDDDTKISWSSSLKQSLTTEQYVTQNNSHVRTAIYRPFTKQFLYFDSMLIHRQGQFTKFFPTADTERENRVIWYKVGDSWPQFALMVNNLPDLMPQGGSQCFPFYVYDEDGTNRRENITDWALEQFRSHYHDSSITKWDIFYYVYGLLHHPEYRERYADNLKRELPRIPFVPQNPPSKSPPASQGETFKEFARIGKQLAEMHLNYESQKRFELEWDLQKGGNYRVEKMRPKNKRKSEAGYSVFDSLEYNKSLTLKGIPEAAFGYRLGNRSALEWVIDQYQVSTDARSGITSDPNQYSENDQYIVELVERVIWISVETVKLVGELAKMKFR
jgi:predicted helicase